MYETSVTSIDLTKKSTNRNNSVPPVDLVGLPGSVDNVQHAGLRRLGRGVEPRGGGQVQPGYADDQRQGRHVLRLPGGVPSWEQS